MSPDIFFSEKEGRSFDVKEGAEINREVLTRRICGLQVSEGAMQNK